MIRIRTSDMRYLNQWHDSQNHCRRQSGRKSEVNTNLGKTNVSQGVLNSTLIKNILYAFCEPILCKSLEEKVWKKLGPSNKSIIVLPFVTKTDAYYGSAHATSLNIGHRFYVSVTVMFWFYCYVSHRRATNHGHTTRIS